MANNVNLERLLTDFGRESQREQNLLPIGVGNSFGQRLASSVGAIGQGMFGGALRAAEAAGAPITTQSPAARLRARLAELNPQENKEDREEFFKILGTIGDPSQVAALRQQFKAADDQKALLENQQEQLNARAKATADLLREKGYPDRATNVEQAAVNGSAFELEENIKFLNDLEKSKKTTSGARYLNVGGGRIFDTIERVYIDPPGGVGKKKDNFIVINDRLYDLTAEEFVTDAPISEVKKTDDMITYEYIAAENKRNGIETPSFTEWLKGEKAYENRSPDRKVYDELKAAATEAGEDFPIFNKWYESQKDVPTTVVKNVNEDTGVETSYLVNSNNGQKIANLGITSMPTLEIISNDDGTYHIYNPKTGMRGEKVQTPEAAAVQQRRFFALLGQFQDMDASLGILQEAKDIRQDMTAVGYAVFSMVPGTDAREVASKVSTIQATMAFDELEKMRKNSPTGGALGNVTELELKLLKDAISGLDPSLSLDAYNNQVAIIQKHYNRYKQALLGEMGDYRVTEDGEIIVAAPLLSGQTEDDRQYYSAGFIEQNNQGTK